MAKEEKSAGRTGTKAAQMDGLRISSRSPYTRTHRQFMASGVSSYALGKTHYVELAEERDEEDEKWQKDLKPVSGDDEEKLDNLFFKAQERAGNLMAFFEVTVLLSPDQALGMHIADVPATPSAASQIPLSTQVTKIEPHGLLQTWTDHPHELTLDETVVLRLASVEDKKGLDGVIYLKNILQSFNSQSGDRGARKLKLTFCREARFKFNFKQRECDGTALHVAAAHKNGEGLLGRLLDERADPQQEFFYSSRGDPGSAQAIHLCAARGLNRHIQILLDYGASVHAVSKVNGKDNFTALHEAASYGLNSTAGFLLKSRADPNAVNFKKHTPLHCAARQGDTRLCCLLKYAGADLKARDANGATPVIFAVERGRFRFDKLFVLMERSFEDLLVVSQLCASVGSEVMRDNSTNKVHPEWREALVKEAKEFPVWATDHWMEIMNNSPGAGEDILDVLSVRPEAQNDTYNPIPRRARLPSHSPILCCYEEKSVWDWSPSWNEFPKWQSELCPGVKSGFLANHRSSRTGAFETLAGCFRWKSGSSFQGQNLSQSSVQQTGRMRQEAAKSESIELVPVKVRQLKLPGIINPDVMDILAFTANHNVLRKPAGQAIISYAWDHVARYYYLTYVFYQMVIIGNLVVEVASPSTTFWGSRVRWSLLAVLAHLELFYEFWEMCGFLCYLQHGRQRYLTNIENLYNWASIAMLMVLVYITMDAHGLQDMPVMLSLLILFRWIQLTWSCRAFGLVGEKILPIMQASFSAHIKGILVVTFCILLGFLHGAMALELGNDLPQHYAVVLGSLKLLLLGDGDGIDVTLGLGNAEEGNPITFLFLFAAMVVFCVCVLNLFIAVHGEAYDSAQEKAFTTFLQERAGICLHCLLRPSWPPRCCQYWRVQHRISVYICLQIFVLAAWALLLREESINVLAPTALLGASAMLGDAILVQRPWNKTSGDKYYLWMCYKESFDTAAQNAERDAGEGSMDGRISRLKRDSTQLYKQLSTEINSMSKQLGEQYQTLSQKVQGMESRLQGLENHMEEMVQNLEYIVSVQTRTQGSSPCLE